MLMLISPAKSLDFDSALPTNRYTQPQLLDYSQQLIDQLQHLSPPDLERLMSISPALADLNMNRFLAWQQPFTPENARPALLAFTGDVYQGMQANQFSDQDFDFAQKHLRILSGLYGLLKPLDLIQAYRLEMGTAFANHAGKNLYEFWGNVITECVEKALAEQGDNTLVNLASNEYYKSVKAKALKNTRIITPVFKDLKGGQYKVISFHAKKARGMMAAFVINERLTDAEALKGFDRAGYYFSAEQSRGDEWVFLRDHSE